MNRSTVKLLGLALLIPGLVLGLTPIIAAYTPLLAGFGSFDVNLGGHSIIAVQQYGALSSASVSPLVWAMAAAGELVLIYVHLTRPRRISRFDVSPR